MRLKAVYPELLRDDVSMETARQLQAEYKAKVLFSPLPVPKTITAVDIAYQTTAALGAVAVAVTMSIPALTVIETGQVAGACNFPYIPGFLGFRELNLVSRALFTLEEPVEIILYDGHGIAHPQRFGAACQLGVALGVPTIGCAKNLYYGRLHGTLGNSLFSSVPIVDETDGATIGVAMRMHENVKPVYISAGHLVDLASAIDIVKACAGGFHLPEPLRQADIISRKRVTFFED
nr:endonuclease V [Candidatus Sigynarchaeota archaeon]